MKRTVAGARQLGLFGTPSPLAESAVDQGPIVRSVQSAHWAEVAAKVPPNIHFGTSSWTFPGWGGLVYEGSPSSADLLKTGLRAYAENPLLRTVGIDRSHYAPLTEGDLIRYASMLPPDYPTLSKVWDELTMFAFPPHPRFGARGGQINDRFFDATRVTEEVLAPYDKVFREHTAPFIVEVAPIAPAQLPSPQHFAERADAFFGALPNSFRYALEVRNKTLVTRELFRVLERHRVGYVFTFWTGMPHLAAQLALTGSMTTDFAVARLMLPPYQRYEDKKAEYAPFDRIVTPDMGMRRDVLSLLRRAAARPTFILVNNKAEGSAPLTILALAELLTGPDCGL